jgi:hypothetical protein
MSVALTVTVTVRTVQTNKYLMSQLLTFSIRSAVNGKGDKLPLTLSVEVVSVISGTLVDALDGTGMALIGAGSMPPVRFSRWEFQHRHPVCHGWPM